MSTKHKPRPQQSKTARQTAAMKRAMQAIMPPTSEALRGAGIPRKG